jgi:hypothetical protein
MGDKLEDLQTAAQPLLPLLPDRAWLPWAAVPRPNGKIDKIPVMGTRTNAPHSWRTWTDALTDLASEPDVAGVGFGIVPGLIALDFDNCRDPITGELTDEAQGELERFNSFAYVTPSHKGFRVVGRNDGAISGGKRIVTLPGGTKVEIFVGPSNHFVTFTSDMIDGYRTIRDISDGVLDYLVGLQSHNSGEISLAGGQSSEPQRGIEAIRAALDAIPNDKQNWDHWCYVGMAVWRSSGGSEEGFNAWLEWSAQHRCHDTQAATERWRHWFKSPPTRLGFGTLYHLARQHRPMFVAPMDGALRTEWTELSKTEKNGEISGENFSTEPRPEIRPEIRPEGPVIGETRVLPYIAFHEATARLDADDFVEGLLVRRSMAAFYGDSNSGKTFLVTDLAFHIAAGKPWRGRQVEQGLVVYIAGEGVYGIQNRIAAWRQHYGIEADVQLPFIVVTTSVNLLRPESGDVEAIVATARQAAAQFKQKPILTVADTLAASMGGGNENASEDMSAVLSAARRVTEELDSCFAWIHHAGKDASRGARGHSSFRAALDTEIEVSDDNGDRLAKVTKQRDMMGGDLFNFRLEVVNLGEDRRGKMVTSCIVEHVAEPIDNEQRNRSVQKRSLKGDQRRAYEVLVNGITEHGSTSYGGHPDLPSVPEDWWRDRFYADAKAGATQEAKQRAFRRAADGLVENRMVGMSGGRVWLT